LDELQEFHLPSWPKSKLIEFSSDKRKRLDVINKCIESLCDIVEKNRSVASKMSIQSVFGRRPRDGEPPASGVLYFAIVSAKNVGASDLETQIRLELVSDGARYSFEDKIDNYSNKMKVRHTSISKSMFCASLTALRHSCIGSTTLRSGRSSLSSCASPSSKH
jgi:hypothetical protein